MFLGLYFALNIEPKLEDWFLKLGGVCIISWFPLMLRCFSWVGCILGSFGIEFSICTKKNRLGGVFNNNNAYRQDWARKWFPILANSFSYFGFLVSTIRLLDFEVFLILNNGVISPSSYYKGISSLRNQVRSIFRLGCNARLSIHSLAYSSLKYFFQLIIKVIITSSSWRLLHYVKLLQKISLFDTMLM